MKVPTLVLKRVTVLLVQ